MHRVPLANPRSPALAEPAAPLRRGPTFSVIVPCSRPAAQARCLRSLEGASTEPAQVILILLAEAEACREAASASRLAGVELVEGFGLLPGAARNLAIRRSALRVAELAFDEDLLRNEENLLLERLRRRGGRAVHCPGLYVYHERRSTLSAFVR